MLRIFNQIFMQQIIVLYACLTLIIYKLKKKCLSSRADLGGRTGYIQPICRAKSLKNRKKRALCGRDQEIVPNFLFFFKKQGIFGRKSTTGSIPSGRGDQLMPQNPGLKRPKKGYFLGKGSKYPWVNEICFRIFNQKI